MAAAREEAEIIEPEAIEAIAARTASAVGAACVCVAAVEPVWVIGPLGIPTEAASAPPTHAAAGPTRRAKASPTAARWPGVGAEADRADRVDPFRNLDHRVARAPVSAPPPKPAGPT